VEFEDPYLQDSDNKLRRVAMRPQLSLSDTLFIFWAYLLQNRTIFWMHLYSDGNLSHIMKFLYISFVSDTRSLKGV